MKQKKSLLLIPSQKRNEEVFVKKILITTSTFPRWQGDTEPAFISDMAQALSHYFKVFVLAPHANGASKQETWGSVEIRRFTYMIPHRWQRLCYGGGIFANLLKSKLNYLLIPFLFLFEAIAVIRLVKKERIDLLYANFAVPQGLVGVLVKRWIKIPVIVNVLGGDIGISNPMLRYLVRYSLKRVDHIVALTPALREAIEQLNLGTHDISIMPLGVNTDLFSPDHRSETIRQKYVVNGAPLLLFVGRLVEKKGVAYLINAMPDVLKKFQQAKLLIIGNGLLANELKRLAQQLQLSDSVYFEGDLDNKKLPQYYASADIFIGPSIIPESGDLEGQGVVFLEAMASGCCTIGTNIGGIPMSVVHEKSGLLVEQKNSRQISQAIIRILEDDALRARLQRDGRQFVIENFDWRAIANRYKELFERFIGRTDAN
ncbi:MAG: glycosyltransferase [candidate division KSB1 bacterium]|nr:glycosyltransferase [candidate division KSB1 bacterium]MDZ7333743.1 glycosyltransferase [candidate division KSB1 bacterium]MDZ7357048.1 glycosyltransferase [candidate division KSB1 bacterium]MDZ7377421.1 glycosyltransferase [candidate division KSB1 bacterium]